MAHEININHCFHHREFFKLSSTQNVITKLQHTADLEMSFVDIQQIQIASLDTLANKTYADRNSILQIILHRSGSDSKNYFARSPQPKQSGSKSIIKFI